MIEELATRLSGKAVVVGVGQLSHGDDGVGMLVARMLAESGIVPVIESGNSPELDTWRIRELSPEYVLFIDAVDFKGSPGDISILQPSDLRALGFDTHRAPLKLTMEYLESELGCKCHLLAIQPHDVRNGALMSEEVKNSAINIFNMLSQCILACKP